MSSTMRGSDNFDTADAVQGFAKAWVNFNGTGTVAIRDQLNVSSITDGGVGIYTINFATVMSNANYTVIGTPSQLENATNWTVVEVTGDTPPVVGSFKITTTVGNAGINRTFSDTPIVSVFVLSS